MRNQLRLTAAAVAAAACFAVSVLALAWSWADLTVSSARAPETAKRLAHMSPDRWRVAFDRLYQAHALDPLNARYTAELGRHYAWLAWRSSAVVQASRSYRRQSRAAFAESLRRRPSWGYAWANYAEARLLEGLADRSTLQALDRAMALGPWETRTQLKSLLLAFSLWDGLSDGQRTEVAATLRRALIVGDEVDLIIRVAVQTGRQNMVENLLTESRHRQLLNQIIAQSGR